MSIENQVQTLVEELKTNGYEVKEKVIPNGDLPPQGYHYGFTKVTGEGRRSVNGGFLVVKDTGEVSYDFFKGGSKYGKHFNSYQGMFDEGWFSSDLDLEGVRNFLGFRN